MHVSAAASARCAESDEGTGMLAGDAWTGVQAEAAGPAGAWVFDAVARAVEAILHTPLLPTDDWTDLAAHALTRAVPADLSMVAFARAQGTDLEVVGHPGWSGAWAAEARRHTVAPLHPVPPSRRWRIPLRVLPARGACGRAEHVLGEGWRESLLGPALLALRPGDVIIGFQRADRPGGDAGIVGLLASSRPEPRLGEHALAVLRAALPVLARRASAAFRGIGSAGRITQREREVIEALIDGKSVPRIAHDLGLSPHTVHDHVKSLHRKLGAKTRGELVARALGHEPPARAPGS
jgi:DNA-binding CsgD family transcriptional regulator